MRLRAQCVPDPEHGHAERRYTQLVRFGPAAQVQIGSTQTTRIIDLAGALVGSKPRACNQLYLHFKHWVKLSDRQCA